MVQFQARNVKIEIGFQTHQVTIMQRVREAAIPWATSVLSDNLS